MRSNVIKIAGIVFLAAGVLALVYGGFTYTSDVHDADLGPIELQVAEKERVNVPVWAGVASVVVGAGLLVLRPRR